MTHPLIKFVVEIIERDHGPPDDGGAYDRKTARDILLGLLRHEAMRKWLAEEVSNIAGAPLDMGRATAIDSLAALAKEIEGEEGGR